MISLTRYFKTLFIAAVASSAAAFAADAPKELRLDYASYSPTSLVLRKMGWVEEEFKSEGITVKWVLSQGSNNALKFLQQGSVDFGSTAGLAAVLAKVGGLPIKGVYIYSKPEWAALAVPKDSPISAVAELKGKKIAATPGTDPYIFALRALEVHGLHKSDVEIVPLQHVIGRTALEHKEVDAWSGLDPHLTASILEKGTKQIYRNPDFCSYGFLNATESFTSKYPDVVRRVIKAYERARAWTLAHPDQAAELMAEEAKISLAVAKAQLKRNDFSNPAPGDEHVKSLKAGVKTLVAEKLVPDAASANRAIDEFVDGSFTKAIR